VQAIRTPDSGGANKSSQVQFAVVDIAGIPRPTRKADAEFSSPEQK
jgi:hypothetical protein